MKINTVITTPLDQQNAYQVTQDSYYTGKSSSVSLSVFPQSDYLHELLDGYVMKGLKTTVYASLIRDDIPSWVCEYRPDYWVKEESGHRVINLEYSPYILDELVNIITVSRDMKQAVFIHVTHPGKDRSSVDFETAKNRRSSWDRIRGVGQ